MRKVSATVIYKDNTLYNLTVNLKNNNFYCSYYEQFGRRWYNIQFINLENPVNIEKFGMEVLRIDIIMYFNFSVCCVS